MKMKYLLPVILLAAACGGGPKLEPGVLYASVISDPKSFNPITARETSTTDVLGFVFEGLVTVDAKTYEVEPNLADTWSVSNEGNLWTFTLRQDVVWSDGAPFTADDVLFTFNDLIFNPKVSAGIRDLLQVDGKHFIVSKIDTYTVTFNTHKPFAPFLRTIGAEILPVHAYGTLKDDFNQALVINTPLDQVIGTSAFRITEYTQGQRVVLERNPRYWKKDENGAALPRLSKIIIHVVPDVDAELEWFRGGKTDFVGMRGLDWPVFIKDAEKKNYTMKNMGPRFTTTYIMFNQNLAGKIPEKKKEWFRNRAFREAVAWAIDRKTVVDGIFNSLAYEQHSSIPEANTVFYDSGVTRYSYNLDKAAGILEKAGFKKKDGKLFDASGTPVAFIIITNSGNNERVRGATVVAEGLRALGMDVKVDAMDFNALVGRLDNDFDWDACVLGLTAGLEPHSGANIWRVEGDLHMFNQKPRPPAEGSPPAQFKEYEQAVATWRKGVTPWEREIEKLIELGASELDSEKRWQIYSRLQRIVSAELPFIYTVSPAALYATRNRIQGVDPSPLGSTTIGAVLHNVEYLTTIEQ